MDARRLPLILVVACLLIALAGCSSFKSKKRLNLGPFAEDMIALAGDIQYGLGMHQPVYLQGYTDVPQSKQLEVLGHKIRAVMRAVIGYSIQVVTLGESELSGPDRADALADYLDGLLRPVLARPVPPMMLTEADLDTILIDIRGRSDLLGSLRASQPVVDEIARLSGEIFDETAAQLEITRQAIQDRIDGEFMDIRIADHGLRKAQLRTVNDIALLPLIRGGDLAAVDTMRVHQPSLRVFLTPGVIPSEETMRQLDERLLFILTALSDLRRQLEPDLVTFREARRELGLMHTTYSAALRQGRVAILAWSRAHGRLAAGVTDPAAIDVLGIARKAAGAAVPF